MTMHPMTKLLLIVVFLGVLFLAGCASYLKPEIGVTAQPEARVELVAEGVQNAAWTSKDLTLTYSYAVSGNIFNFSGSLSFDRSLTNSFSSIKTFSLKMSFLDKDGRVLESVDITPLFRYLGDIPGTLPVRVSALQPAEAAGIAFNYFGIFRSGNHEEMGGDGWEIFYFPFD